MNNYILKACRRCGGDLAEDSGDWICLQCGRYSYVGLYGQAEPPSPPRLPSHANLGNSRAESRRAARGADGHSGRSGGRKTATAGPIRRATRPGALP